MLLRVTSKPKKKTSATLYFHCRNLCTCPAGFFVFSLPFIVYLSCRFFCTLHCRYHEGNHFVLYYQSGAQVIRAELPEDAHTIDDFMQVMQQLGLARANLEYDKEQIALPARAVDCSAQSFFDMLKKYDYPIEEPINDSFVVYGDNVDGTIYWTYEQSDSTAYQKTQFTMNYAYQLCSLADSRFSYFSGENYEGWIIDSDTQGYEIMIHCGGAGYYIHGITNDDAMKAHILEMIEAVGFGGE